MELVLSDSQKRTMVKKFKLHFWVFAVVERLEKGSKVVSEYESRFVEDGIASITVFVKPGATHAEKSLKKAGLKMTNSEKNVWQGKIKIEKLYKLAALEFVEYVSP